MSNASEPPPQGWGSPRRVIGYCVLSLIAVCVVWIIYAAMARKEGIMTAFYLLDLLSVIGIGVWILRPDRAKVDFVGRWMGRVAVFVGTSLAVIVFLFVTCFAVVITR